LLTQKSDIGKACLTQETNYVQPEFLCSDIPDDLSITSEQIGLCSLVSDQDISTQETEFVTRSSTTVVTAHNPVPLGTITLYRSAPVNKNTLPVIPPALETTARPSMVVMTSGGAPFTRSDCSVVDGPSRKIVYVPAPAVRTRDDSQMSAMKRIKLI